MSIETLNKGSKILQNVDVSSIVTGLALGIANAQEQLDNNSVKQITRLSETEVAGKSLLQLGFQPAFYAFDYADISAAIQLKMTLEEEIEVDLSIQYDAAKKKGYKEEHFEKIENSYKDEQLREFKSSKKFWTTISNEHSLKVNQSTVNTSTETGCLKRIEETKERLSSDSKVERADAVLLDTVDITNNSSDAAVKFYNNAGFGMISMIEHNTEYIGIVKIKNYTSLSINLSNSLTINGADLNANLALITGAGFKFGLSDNATLTTYFGFSKHDSIDFDYAQGTAPKNTDSLKEKLKALAFIMINDSDVSITITGYTDSVSGNSFNQALGLKRAKTVASYLTCLGVPAVQINPVLSNGETNAQAAVGDNTKSADYRKVSIEVNTNGNEYIYIEGAPFVYQQAATIVADWSITNSGILKKYDKVTSGATVAITANSGSDITINETATDISEARTKLSSSHNLLTEVSGDVVYVLREDAKIEYTVFSNTSEEITIEDKSSNTQNTNNSEDTLEIHKTINSKYYAKSDLNSIEDPKISALSGSLDVRYARKFGMSVEGNASVSARMISVPPPSGLEDYIESLTPGSSQSNN